ncbi:MAG TPA: hypothetical protein VHZ76_01585, partial [Gammaproteobacteria bacterium]|nr:hypothetical protein [Gammaproteobacteria bacterium]
MTTIQLNVNNPALYNNNKSLINTLFYAYLLSLLAILTYSFAGYHAGLFHIFCFFANLLALFVIIKAAYKNKIRRIALSVAILPVLFVTIWLSFHLIAPILFLGGFAYNSDITIELNNQLAMSFAHLLFWVVVLILSMKIFFLNTFPIMPKLLRILFYPLILIIAAPTFFITLFCIVGFFSDLTHPVVHPELLMTKNLQDYQINV